jgi:hypothetical protein
MSWDPVSDKLIVADIGLNTWEEVDIVTKGSDYGYAEREGIEQLLVTNDFNNGDTGSQTSPPTPFPNPDSLTVAGIPAPVTPVYPATAYGHKDGDAISGGFVYRGSLMPQLTDKYIFGDITTGRLFYADVVDLIANDDGVRTTLAPIHELQVVFDSPYDSPDQGLVNRRLFDIAADEYAHRGGSIPPYVLPCCAPVTSGNDPDGVPYGGGRADIRLTLGGDGEIYVLSKSDGMIRLMAGMPPTVVVAASANPNPVTGTTTSLSVLGADDGGEGNLTYTWSTTGTPPAPVSFSVNGTNGARRQRQPPLARPASTHSGSGSRIPAGFRPPATSLSPSGWSRNDFSPVVRTHGILRWFQPSRTGREIPVGCEWNDHRHPLL